LVPEQPAASAKPKRMVTHEFAGLDRNRGQADVLIAFLLSFGLLIRST
jgi:hypothetical protein